MKRTIKSIGVVALMLFVMLSLFISCDAEAWDKRDEFWETFKDIVEDKVPDTIAEVEWGSNYDITVTFIDNVDVGDVYSTAMEMFGLLGSAVEDGKLELDGTTFDLKDDEGELDDDVVVAVAKHLLGAGEGQSGTQAALDFLTEKGKVTSAYKARVWYEGEAFNIKGTLVFDVTTPK